MRHVQQILICLLFIVAGCTATTNTGSQLHMSTIRHIGQHVVIAPTNFIQQTASAEYIIVKPTLQDPSIKDISLTLTGKDAQDVVRAISLLRNDRIVGVSYGICGCVDSKLEFYRGTNCLGVALFQDDLVTIGDEYEDHTGTLKKIDKRIWDKVERQVSGQLDSDN